MHRHDISDAPKQPRRRQALAALASLGLGLPLARSSAAAALPDLAGESHAARITLDLRRPGAPAPRGILGANVQWVDRGDAMLDAQGAFDPAMLKLAQALGPTTLRYPGGDLADNYHWELGIGAQAHRSQNIQTGNRAPKMTLMGSQELLELCEATGAEPLFSVNIATGTAEEAARWVAWANRSDLRSRLTGRRLPPVRRWELGNEPYLKIEKQPQLWTPPVEFARRADAFIAAMRAVDPDIRIGLPLCNDFRNGVPINHYPGFSDTLLAHLTGRFDEACVHNAYAPFAFGGAVDEDTLYWAAMASTPTIAKDFDMHRRRLDRLRPGGAHPFAVTEYNALFTLGRGTSDGWIVSPTGAMYVADALRLFATRPDVPLAQIWSLSGNWQFGLIHQDRYPRPTYEVLRLYGELLRGRLLAPTVDVATVAVPAISTIEAAPAVPLIEALGTIDGHTLRLLLIHKDPGREAQVELALAGLGAAGASAEPPRWTLLTAEDRMADDDAPGALRREDRALPAAPPGASAPLRLTLPPHSVAMLTLTLAADPAGV